MKRCPQCRAEKPLDEFHIARQSRDGRAGYCKPCAREYAMEWKYANIDHVREVARAGKDREAARKCRQAKEDPTLVRRHTLKTRHSLTLEQYETRAGAQGGACAICGKPPKQRPLSIDHDHWCCPGDRTCGQCIRGLLCVRCNSCLGWLETFPSKISDYLEAAK